jgi:hypothetical protein
LDLSAAKTISAFALKSLNLENLSLHKTPIYSSNTSSDKHSKTDFVRTRLYSICVGSEFEIRAETTTFVSRIIFYISYCFYFLFNFFIRHI